MLETAINTDLGPYAFPSPARYPGWTDMLATNVLCYYL